MPASSSISLLGTGWLGSALADHFLAQHYTVKGSTTTPEKLITLAKRGIAAFYLNIDSDATLTQDLTGFFDAKHLIITLPFRRSFTDPRVYLTQCRSLQTAIENSPIEQVIFTSSTSIYPNTNQCVTESTPIISNNPRTKTLSDVENFFLTTLKTAACIIRFGGLFGPGREKSHCIQANAPGGNTPVNRIHLTDCIGLIDAIVTQNKHQTIYNGVHPSHPTKSRFYQLPLQPTQQPHKRVSAQKAIDELGYVFQHNLV